MLRFSIFEKVECKGLEEFFEDRTALEKTSIVGKEKESLLTIWTWYFIIKSDVKRSKHGEGNTILRLYFEALLRKNDLTRNVV